MKKGKEAYFKKIIGFFLVIIIMVCSVELVFTKEEDGIVVKAAEKTIKAEEELLVDKICYTAFGDSIASGYGLPGYQPTVTHGAITAYREQVTEALKTQYQDTTILADSLAIDGLKSTDLRNYLTDPQSPQYETFRKAAAESDIITLSIGSNDILGPFMEAGAEELGCSIGEIYNTLDKKLTSGSLMELFSLLNSAEKMNKILAGLPEDMDSELAAKAIAEYQIEGNEEFNQACIQFAENFQVILETLHDLSPQAEIFVTNIYNPYKGVFLTNPLSSICVFDVGNLAEFYIRKLNEVFTEDSELYHLIDVKTSFEHAEVNPVNTNVVGNFGIDFTLENYNLDPHPSIEGHTIIASLLKNSISSVSIPVRKGLPEENIDFKAGNFHCRLISSNGNKTEDKTVMITGVEKSVKKVVIPDTITIGNNKFMVTLIGTKAWQKDKKITSLVIGTNVERIQKQAFYKCKNLKKIKVTSKKITKVGSKSFKKLSKEVKFQFPKECKKIYKKLFLIKSVK